MSMKVFTRSMFPQQVSLLRRRKSSLLLAGALMSLALVAALAAVSALTNLNTPLTPGISAQQDTSFTVESLSITSSPDGDVYVTGENIRIEMTFSAMPDSWSFHNRPTLKLQVGDNERTMLGGFDGEICYFDYTVVADDLDIDGVSVNADSLGGYAVVDGLSVDLSGLSHDALTGGQAHRVRHPQPTVDSIAFDTTPTGDVYEAGDQIKVKLGFSANVRRVSSDPLKLNLKVGDNDRPMRSSYLGSDVTFSYTVKTSDVDTDGVSVDGDSLTGKLKVGSVTFDASDIDHSALDGGSTHQVNTDPPTIESMAFDSTPADTLYLTGETIQVEVEFSEDIVQDSSDPLTLDLQIGSNTRAMSASIDSTTATFSYTVTNTDSDTDGVSVAADSLDGTIIVDSISLAASLIGNDALGGGDAHRVNPAAPTIEDMEFSSTGPYTIGDTISIEVEFDATVEGDSSDPLTLTLQIGDDQRTATGIFEGRLIYFQYTVVAADVDTDGAAVVANSMSGSLIYNSITYDGSDIAVAALDGGGDHKVNRAPPTVSSITITSEPTDGIYETGDRISVTVDFGEQLTEDSSDRVTLKLQVGTRVRTLTGSLDGAEAYLGYRVVAEDYDIDGVSVIADSLDGTLESGAYTWDASAISNNAVDGGDDHIVNPNQITVEQIRFQSSPADNIFDTGETISIEVEFSSTPTEVSSDPIKLAVQIGDEVKSLTGGFDGEYAYFRYTVTADDFAPDGVTVEANSLSGTLIVDGNRIDMSTVEHAALEGGASHLVNRPGAPAVESVTITSTHDEHIYVEDDDIEVTVTFGNPVQADDGEVTLLLQVGDNQRTMAGNFDGTEKAVFSYTVQNADYDSDGVAVVADSMSGDIGYGGGNYTYHASGLSVQALEGGEDHRVNVPILRSVRWNYADWHSSDPGTDGAYHTGDVISVFADINVHVSLNLADISNQAKLRIRVGDQDRFATHTSGGGGLGNDRFDYVVTDEDTDLDGVSVPANAFSGTFATAGAGVIDISGFQHEGLSSNFRVNPEPDIDSIEITSTPEQSTGYMPGEAIIVTVKFFEEVEIGSLSREEHPMLSLILHGVPSEDDDDDDTRVVEAFANVESDSRYDEIDFVYVIEHTDLALDGVSIEASSIDANGSSVTLVNEGVFANLEHSAVAQDKSQIVDPRLKIVSITFDSAPDDDSFYGIDDVITVKVVFNQEAQLVSPDPRNLPSLTGLDYDQDDGTTARTFTYLEGTFTNTWLFGSTVEDGANSYSGISLDAFDADDDLNDRINSRTGAAKFLEFDGLDKDATQQAYGGPVATSVSITSTPDSSDGYEEDEKFTFEVSFDNELLVIEDDPEIDLQVGSNVRTATLIDDHEITGIRKLQFEYVFTDDDADSNGIEILDTWFLIDGDFDRGYFLTGDPADSSTYGQPIWKFVNPSPGMLTSHKVQSSTATTSPSGISWLPGD